MCYYGLVCLSFSVSNMDWCFCVDLAQEIVNTVFLFSSDVIVVQLAFNVVLTVVINHLVKYSVWCYLHYSVSVIFRYQNASY